MLIAEDVGGKNCGLRLTASDYPRKGGMIVLGKGIELVSFCCRDCGKIIYMDTEMVKKRVDTNGKIMCSDCYKEYKKLIRDITGNVRGIKDVLRKAESRNAE